jgi:hypothetical protein
MRTGMEQRKKYKQGNSAKGDVPFEEVLKPGFITRKHPLMKKASILAFPTFAAFSSAGRTMALSTKADFHGA